MAGFKDFAHEIRKKADDYPAATVSHVAVYAKTNNRVYIIDESGNLADFEVSDIYCDNIEVSGNALIGGIVDVSGNAYFWSDVYIDGDFTVNGTLTVDSSAYFDDVIVYGTLNTGSSIVVDEGSITSLMGTVDLTAGYAPVPNTHVSATTRIFLTTQQAIGTPGFLYVAGITGGQQFGIQSSSGTDSSKVAWLLIDPQ